jgi:hypothetical protein
VNLVVALSNWQAGHGEKVSMGEILGVEWEEEQYRLAEARRIAAGEPPPSYAYLLRGN